MQGKSVGGGGGMCDWVQQKFMQLALELGKHSDAWQGIGG